MNTTAVSFARNIADNLRDTRECAIVEMDSSFQTYEELEEDIRSAFGRIGQQEPDEHFA